MTQPRNTLDAAIRTYLGGDWETSAIQVGLREERLTQSFGTEASALKLQIEAILADALRYARDRTKSDTMVDPTCLWVAEMHPSLSDVACRKIESDTTFRGAHPAIRVFSVGFLLVGSSFFDCLLVLKS